MRDGEIGKVELGRRKAEKQKVRSWEGGKVGKSKTEGWGVDEGGSRNAEGGMRPPACNGTILRLGEKRPRREGGIKRGVGEGETWG